MYFSKQKIEKTKIIPQKYTPFGKKQAKGMYFSKYEINKTKIIPQKYTPFGKKTSKRDVFFYNNKHRTEDVLNNKHKSIDRN